MAATVTKLENRQRPPGAGKVGGPTVWSVPDFFDAGLGCQVGYFPES
ncbi:hypothetical protein Ae717Ps2_6091 [Pseudonocardia sp. Ae717_Ps2]|nr:hypothetical protein [Pseudonocardia sp. Ae717_Ps2]OLM27610.1 hypothetical protein Ae717Ps2_7286 [Pseudonocardia sp. Ae717_Ps2]OLM28772.1 hypothetical protein Ae717Ps2_6091 [Pseudonocardia sp. Ae717_Ps2]